MKVKLNLNVDSAKRLLIQHGEKAAFGLAVCLLLLFLWKTVGLEVLGADKEPGPLTALSERTRQHVLESVWDPDAKNIKIEDYPTRAEHVPLNDGDYPPLMVYYDKPLWEQHEKRPVPKVLPVEELLASASEGFLAVKKDGEDAGRAEAGESHAVRAATGSKGHGAKLSKDLMPKGSFFVSVTGLVPLRKQITAYDDAFRSALRYDSKRDTPTYEDIKVERADVVGNNPDKAVWEEIDLGAVRTFVGTWSSEAISDVVDDEYIDDRYTMPLGPLLGEDWDPAIAGHPKIPLAGRLDDTKKPEKEVAAAPPVERGAGWGARGKSGTKAGAAAKPAAQAQAAKGTPAASKREQKLFRFVDYTVKPGKQYRYRVKLLLQNPNQDVADRFLSDPALSHTATLETDWSEPSAVVTVRRGVSIFAGPILKPAPVPHDPEVEICVVSFDPLRGGAPTKKKNVQRGALLNFSEKEMKVLSPDHMAVNKWEKVDVLTNTLIVDVQGGRKLGSGRKALVEPVEILVLDPDGRVSVRDELDDANEFHSHLDPLDQPEKTETTKIEKNPYEELKPRGGTAKPRARSSGARAPRAPAN
ncbi:MAG TPA: hypothetical protein VHY91_04665 [Pirellulales bacterium]|jgi:hypothetical protein|nr:hypothetical protein [Pirellulales bacterium]